MPVTQLQSELHCILDLRVAAVALKPLPSVEEVISVDSGNKSAWAHALRIAVRHQNGEEESYFMKVAFGSQGLESLKGEYEATAAIYAITPDFCPKPIAWGTLETAPDTHFYLRKYYEFFEGVPEPESFCEKLAMLHSSHTSPEGKFGFHCTTYNGNIPQDNTWSDSWELFFANGLRHVLNIREARAGPDAELDELLPGLFDKVIPRLLRPLESNGRSIEPTLVHGNLWCGNAAIIDDETEEGIIFDPSSFWAHNEYELGNWRPVRNKFTRRYFEAYQSIIPKAEPEADFDDRNALYALRFNLNAATLFTQDKNYLQMVIDEIRRLTEKYPDGYVDEVGQDKPN
ncbi:Fructosamine kinase-domain-containing protein [Dichotomopilus funicola]|uniref:protein-ribulosamine 3-kinase n=1 Tax=Dichotomopilus funicola TaxID=1934379 RepID=A0AAN6ZJX3_9PEZI|nr:Fructosamine kinase-domain-containing protein [Dichotomopilus funicola]